MASLVTITKETRLIIKFGGISLGILLLIYFGIKGGGLIRSIFFPKPPPPPLQAFGKLPRLTFPSPGSTSIQYRVNTVNGSLPALPDRVNVYKLKQQQSDLLALKNARNTVSTEAFVNNETKLSDSIYQWTQQNTGVAIQYDIANKFFTISSNYLNNPSLSSTSLLPSQDTITGDVLNFLDLMGADKSDIKQDKISVNYMQLGSGALVPAQNLASATYATITMPQNDVDNIPIIYDTPTTSLINFTVSYPQQGQMQVLSGEYFDHQPDLNQKSDYPIKSSQQAYEDLQKGNAYVINPQNLTDVDITNVSLNYYLSKNTNDYLLPVIVFTGINFTAYVQAIPATSLQ